METDTFYLAVQLDRYIARRSDRQTDIQTYRYTDRHTDRQTYRQTERQTERLTYRQTGRLTGRRTDGQTYRQTDHLYRVEYQDCRVGNRYFVFSSVATLLPGQPICPSVHNWIYFYSGATLQLEMSDTQEPGFFVFSQ